MSSSKRMRLLEESESESESEEPEEDEEEESEEDAGPSTPWKKYGLDLDTLECPICTELFSPPVFQCNNGHAACSSCCQKLNKGICPFCSLPTGRIRCLAIEKVIESLRVECKHGCGSALKIRDRDEHERSLCEYRPIECPVRDCTHRGPTCTISNHLKEVHSVLTVEWRESTRSARFEMGLAGLWCHSEMLVKTKEAWLFVSMHDAPKGQKFTCESVWAAKEVVFKLTVKMFPQMQRRAYSMESNLSPVDVEKYLFVPGDDYGFVVTVSLQ